MGKFNESIKRLTTYLYEEWGGSCPNCGYNEEPAESIEFETDAIYVIISCLKCDFSLVESEDLSIQIY
jgi:hypothetical protein